MEIVIGLFAAVGVIAIVIFVGCGINNLTLTIKAKRDARQDEWAQLVRDAKYWHRRSNLMEKEIEGIKETLRELKLANYKREYVHDQPKEAYDYIDGGLHASRPLRKQPDGSYR